MREEDTSFGTGFVLLPFCSSNLFAWMQQPCLRVGGTAVSNVQIQAMFVGPVTTLEAHRHVVHGGWESYLLPLDSEILIVGTFTLSEEKFAGDHSYWWSGVCTNSGVLVFWRICDGLNSLQLPHNSLHPPRHFALSTCQSFTQQMATLRCSWEMIALFSAAFSIL